MSRALRFGAVAVAIGVVATVAQLVAGDEAALAYEPADFTLVEVISNLDRPTGVEVAPNGDIFVIEKDGKLKAFDGFDDTTADVVVDWRWRTMNPGDQGMLGLAVDPQYGAGRDFVYVQYVLDEIPGENDPPHWNDTCPVALTDGCVVTSTVARIEVDPATNAMIGWTDLLTSATCLQFQGHSSNDLAFGPDGFLYASIGDGASFTVADHGQLGGNPCQDPPYPDEPTPANSEGGALRTMDLLTSVGGEANDPVWYNGVVLRIDPDTGEAAAGNPLSSVGVAGDDMIIAHGLRNPYRLDFRPGTDELWIADVGSGEFEEINVISDVDDGHVENFGWPCWEGPQLHGIYSQYGMCQTLINDPSSFDLTTDLTQAHFSYNHDDPVGDCAGGSSAATAVAFGTGGPYPAEYTGALFFNDYARGCLWAMLPDADGVPDPATIDTLATGAIAVDLDIGPSGELLLVEVGDFSNGSGRIRRLDFIGDNQPPTAVIEANTLTGVENETQFEFDGSDSSDPEGGVLTYEWDLDGDGSFDQTGPTASIVYSQPGSYEVRLRVTDPGGATGEATVTANVSNTPPVATITAPASTLTWRVGDEISFSGTGFDGEDGTLDPATPGQEWEWLLILHHCPDFDCHEHIEGSWSGVGSGSFATPDHEYPSWLELRLVVHDSTGATGTASVELQPVTSTITLATDPPGLEVAGGVGASPQVAPLAIEAIEGGDVSIVAPSPQTLGGTNYSFRSWSDGGSQIHDVTVPADDVTLTAEFTAVVAGFRDGWTGVAPSGGWTYLWNEGGPLGDSASYVPLQWNGFSYDSDGAPGVPSADEFPYGGVGAYFVHPGRSMLQGAADDRHAIIRYMVDQGGSYEIVSSMISDLDCPSDEVEVSVLVNDVLLSTHVHDGGTVASAFDQSVGVLGPGDTIDVAVGPGDYDTCDTTDLDFFLSRTDAPSDQIIATFTDDFNPGTPTDGWSYLWNESSSLGDSSGYEPLQWNSVFYDSDGVVPGPAPDFFAYGLVSGWGVHAGRSVAQGAGADRNAIVRYTIVNSGSYAIVDSMVANHGCVSDGVEVTVLVDDAVVSTVAYTPPGTADFDVDLGQLAAGTTIDVAVGPGDYDTCDAMDLDFSLSFEPSDQGVITAIYSSDFTGPSPSSGWSYLWNEGGPIGDSAGYVPLVWNTIHYDSDGQLGGVSGDDFMFGLVADWGLHAGLGTPQGTAFDRFAIVRYTMSTPGSYQITSSAIADRGCISAGSELQVRVNDVLVSTTFHIGSDPAPFDTALGSLAPGDTIDVALGPDGFNNCDAYDVDFSILRTG